VAVTDARIEFADFLSNELWRASDQLAVDARDSARVAVIALLVAFDEQQAVNSYGQLQVLRMRDRAAAEIVQRMVNTDADAAAVLAEPLEDTIARNKAFSALAQRAVAGGRLVSATRFADRTVSGEARASVRSLRWQTHCSQSIVQPRPALVLLQCCLTSIPSPAVKSACTS